MPPADDHSGFFKCLGDTDHHNKWYDFLFMLRSNHGSVSLVFSRYWRHGIVCLKDVLTNSGGHKATMSDGLDFQHRVFIRSPVLWTVDLMFCACFFLFFPNSFFPMSANRYFRNFSTWRGFTRKRSAAMPISLKVPSNKNEGRKTPNFAQSRA